MYPPSNTSLVCKYWSEPSMSALETSYATPHVQACNKWKADTMMWLKQNSILFDDEDKKIPRKVYLSLQ